MKTPRITATRRPPSSASAMPLEQRHDAGRELVLRLRDDEGAVEDGPTVPAELERRRDAEPGLVRPGRLEIELQVAPLGDRGEVDQRASAAGAGEAPSFPGRGRLPGRRRRRRCGRPSRPRAPGPAPGRSSRSPARRRASSRRPPRAAGRRGRGRCVYDCNSWNEIAVATSANTITPAKKRAGSWKRRERNMPAPPLYPLLVAGSRAGETL